MSALSWRTPGGSARIRSFRSRTKGLGSGVRIDKNFCRAWVGDELEVSVLGL